MVKVGINRFIISVSRDDDAQCPDGKLYLSGGFII